MGNFGFIIKNTFNSIVQFVSKFLKIKKIEQAWLIPYRQEKNFRQKAFNKNIKNPRKCFMVFGFIRVIPKTYLSGQGNFNHKGFNIKRARFNVISVAILIIFQLHVLTGCSPFRKGDELTKFKSFQFSFQDPSNSKYFSVLFSQSDTFFLKRYSHSNTDTLFYSILPDSGRSIINIFVIKINSFAFDSLRSHPLEDFNSSKASSFLYFDYSDGHTDINIHSLHPPTVFKKFNNWVNKIIDSLKFNIADTSIEFKEDKKIREVIVKCYPQ